MWLRSQIVANGDHLFERIWRTWIVSNLARRNPALQQPPLEPIVPEQHETRRRPRGMGTQSLARSTSNIIPTERNDDVSGRETREIWNGTVLRQRIGDVESGRGCRKYEIHGNYRKQPRSSEDGAAPDVDQKEAERATEHEKSVGTGSTYELERADYQGNHGTRKRRAEDSARRQKSTEETTVSALSPSWQPAASGATHTARPNQGP